jgi:hypothetical protein
LLFVVSLGLLYPSLVGAAWLANRFPLQPAVNFVVSDADGSDAVATTPFLVSLIQAQKNEQPTDLKAFVAETGPLITWSQNQAVSGFTCEGGGLPKEYRVQRIYAFIVSQTDPSSPDGKAYRDLLISDELNQPYNPSFVVPWAEGKDTILVLIIVRKTEPNWRPDLKQLLWFKKKE